MEKEILKRDLIIKGNIISVDRLIYADTIKYREVKSKRDYSVSYGARYLVKVKISNKYKGHHSGDTVNIFTGFGGGDCGFAFEVGKDYLIFGNSVTLSRTAFPLTSRNRKRRLKVIERITGFETSICTYTEEYDVSHDQQMKKYF